MKVNIIVNVVDAESSLPLSAVKVTYFAKKEADQLKLIEAERRTQKQNLSPEPSGISAVTDDQGIAKFSCSFAAAFIFQDDPSKFIQSEWRPTGFLRFEKAGYPTIQRNMGEFFLSPPYKGRETPNVVQVYLKRN